MLLSSSVLACVLRGPRTLELCRLSIPELKPGWVLVRVRYAGICGTDIAMFRGTYKPRKLPIIPGHEVVGIVEDVGPEVSRDIIGRKVVFEINVTCGRCKFCKKGLYTHCQYRKAIGIDIDGGFAEYVAVPYNNLHFVDDLDDLDAVLIEPAAAIMHAIQNIPSNTGRKCAIIGQGPLAYLAAKLFEVCGYSVTVIVKGGERARYFTNFNTISIDEIYEHYRNIEERPDIVLEATGSRDGIGYAIDLVKPRGIIISKSTHGELSCIDYTKIVINEITIMGSRCGLRDEWEYVIDLVRRKRLTLREAITHTFNLSEVEKAFETADSRRGLKVILKCH